MKIFKSLLLTLLFISLTSIYADDQTKTELQKKLDSIDGITYEKIEMKNPEFTECYKIFIEQPLDHNNINAGSFHQKIYLAHRDFDRPALIETEGYSAYNHTKELSDIIKTNQVIVEHRYFGESAPDSLDWQYLTVEQAAADHHKVIETFKNIYPGKWIASGISKGGQTSIFYRYLYPNDVDVTIPYVAPLNLEKEDSRILSFIDNVGDEACREKMLAFQRGVLENRDSIIVLMKELQKKKEYNFTMPISKILEYNVLEYSFAFWQWGKTPCNEIPGDTATVQEMFDHLINVSSLSYFDQKSIDYFAPFFYQAYTQIGYYGYDTKPFSDLLVELDGEYESSIYMAPKTEMHFDGTLMNKINDWVINDAENMLFIYGEYDPWSATSVTVSDKTNLVKMVKKRGSHATRIRTFEGKEKEKIYKTLEEWLEVKIER